MVENLGVTTNVAKATGSGLNLTHQPRRRRAADPLLEVHKYEPTPEEIAALPDPTPILSALAAAVVEVLSGVRSADHIASLVSDQVYERLRARASARAQLNATSGRPRLAPKFAVHKVHQESPKPGVIESVVLLSSAARTRAVTIRLEPFNKRWRATNINVL